MLPSHRMFAGSTGKTYGHAGFFPGYLTDMQYFPELGSAVAVQFNTDNGRQLKRGLGSYIEAVVRAITEELKR